MTEDTPYDWDSVGFMGRPLYFDRQGEPISLRRWGELHDDLDYLRVGLDTSPALEDVATASDPLDTSEPVVTISTVWLGINHGWGGGPPVIFETMIFGGPLDNEMMRYCTEAEAIDGHWRTVLDLREGREVWWLEDGDELTTATTEPEENDG